MPEYSQHQDLAKAERDLRTPALLSNRRSERGVTVIEYAMISGLIAVAVVLAVTLLGQLNKNSMDDTASKLSAVMST